MLPIPLVGELVRYRRAGVGVYVCVVEEVVLDSNLPLRLRPLQFAGRTLRPVDGRSFRAGLTGLRAPVPVSSTSRSIQTFVPG